MKKMNNKGFSLVELIIVIAIMAILVGVLAPQFMKYVEQSRRSSDISTAEEIRQAIIADISDGNITGSGTTVAFSGGVTDAASVKTGNGAYATSISDEPEIRGNLVSGKFLVTYDCVAGTCEVYADSYLLTSEGGASEYKAATSK